MTDQKEKWMADQRREVRLIRMTDQRERVNGWSKRGANSWPKRGEMRLIRMAGQRKRIKMTNQKKEIRLIKMID